MRHLTAAEVAAVALPLPGVRAVVVFVVPDNAGVVFDRVQRDERAVVGAGHVDVVAGGQVAAELVRRHGGHVLIQPRERSSHRIPRKNRIMVSQSMITARFTVSPPDVVAGLFDEGGRGVLAGFPAGFLVGEEPVVFGAGDQRASTGFDSGGDHEPAGDGPFEADEDVFAAAEFGVGAGPEVAGLVAGVDPCRWGVGEFGVVGVGAGGWAGFEAG